MLKRLLGALLAAICLLCAFGASAELPRPTVAPGPTRAIEDAGFAVPGPPRCFYVLDGADALSEETERRLFFVGSAAFAQYGAQLVVATVDSTGGANVGDYAYTLYNRWGIGTMRPSSGLLLLLAVGDGEYCAVEGPNRELGYYFVDALDSLDGRFERGDYDGFVQSFADRYVEAMIGLSDAGPKRGDYGSYADYRHALASAVTQLRAESREAEFAWLADGGDWTALRAEGGGGVASSRVFDRQAVRDKRQRAQAARETETEAEDEDEFDLRQSLLTILVVLGIVALLVFDSRHGWNISFFLLRVIIDALLYGHLRDGSGSSGRGSRSSGGGGRSSGGGAGRGR